MKDRDKIIYITCPCCNRQIEITMTQSGRVISIFSCDDGIEFGLMKGGDKYNV